MPSIEPAILRSLEGLADRTGRTLVVVGPPMSGKSAVLTRLRDAVGAAGGQVVQVAGTYRGRAVPFSALERLDRPSEAATDEPAGEEDAPMDAASTAPMAPIAIAPEALGPSRRRDGRSRTTFLGEAARTRGPPARDVNVYWEELLPRFRGDEAAPVVLLAEEAGLFDPPSRDFLLDLSRRARLRPLLIALTLDTTASTAGVWEEALLGRPDVDWLRLGPGAPDAREVVRLRGLLADLPMASLRLLGYLTLLGGETTTVVLARIAQQSVVQLQDGLKPLASANLARVREGRVAMPDPGSISILKGLFSEDDRKRWHRVVAEGLQALSAEPPLARRIEIAHHYLEAGADALALPRLLEAAEISLGLQGYDEATRLLAESIRCLAELPVPDRSRVEPELRLLSTRALFGSGCLAEAQAELREGVEDALRDGASAADLASWLEPLIPALQSVGPRTGLSTTIVELVERLHDSDLVEPEVLLESLLPIYDLDREFTERSRAEALRAAQNARRLTERPLQALGLFVMGVSRLTGTVKEVAQAERFLRASRYLLRNSRRWELDYVVGEFECRVLERQGKIDQALALRRESTAALQRSRLPSVELLHEVGIARILLDRPEPSAAQGPLDRARRLAESLHLVPPAPALLDLWLLEGRALAVGGSIGPARDRFSALTDLPLPFGLPRVRAEATLRLALMEKASGRVDEAAQLVERLHAAELRSALPPSVRETLDRILGSAAQSQHGGAPLHRITAPAGASASDRREKRRS